MIPVQNVTIRGNLATFQNFFLAEFYYVAELDQIKQIVAESLQIGSRVESMDANTALLGSIPEFDSMAVVTVITSIEEYFDIYIEDDEISGEVFETLGSLHAFVSEKVAC